MTEEKEEKPPSPLKLGQALIKALEKCPQKPAKCIALIEEGADTGIIRMSDRYNALMLAAGVGLAPVVEAALKKSSPVDKKNDMGNTALLEALDAFSLALESKEHMPFIDQYGRARNYPRTIKALLKHNANTTIKNSSGKDALDIIRDLHQKHATEDTKRLLDEIFSVHKRQEGLNIISRGLPPARK